MSKFILTVEHEGKHEEIEIRPLFSEHDILMLMELKELLKSDDSAHITELSQKYQYLVTIIRTREDVWKNLNDILFTER